MTEDGDGDGERPLGGGGAGDMKRTTLCWLIPWRLHPGHLPHTIPLLLG